MKGKLIVLDGCEGCGKSTQAKLLEQYCAKQGYPVTLYNEPGSTRIGTLIREILLDPENADIGMRTETMLFMAARAQLVVEKIRPDLDNNKMVILDRYFTSTLAYQLNGDQLRKDDILLSFVIATKSCWPDFTIVLDIPYEEMLKRKHNDSLDRIEQRPEEYHKQVRENYKKYVPTLPGKCGVLNGLGTTAEVHDRILRFLTLN